MKNYKKIKCIQGLILGLEEQIYRLKQFKEINEEKEEILINSYMDSIKEVINGNS